MQRVFDDKGIRFDFPSDWEMETSEEGPVTTVALQSDSGPAFAIVTIDETCPEAREVSEAALEALREEYPALEADAVVDMLAGQPAAGHDIEFISLDVTNSAATRCARTPRRTILVFGQWSDLEGDETADVMRSIWRTLEETDAD